jgi:hypothetical protein
VCFIRIHYHGGRRGNTAQALVDGGIQWLRVKPWMCSIRQYTPHPSSYCLIRMATEIAINSPAFSVIVDFLFAHNRI